MRLGSDQALAHNIKAGANAFRMPFRLKPCGLNQMYSQHYGTIPIARRADGFQNTVEDVYDQAIMADCATGIIFDDASAVALVEAVRCALALRED